MSKAAPTIPSDALQEWKQAIGEFMVSFNECEFWVHQIVQLLVGPNLAELISEERLVRRARAAQAAIKDAALPIPAERVDLAFRDLRALAEYRNILAHNAPMLNLYGNGDTEESRLVIELSNRKGKSTSLEEIKQRAVDAFLLDVQMLQLYQDLLKATSAKS